MPNSLPRRALIRGLLAAVAIPLAARHSLAAVPEAAVPEAAGPDAAAPIVALNDALSAIMKAGAATPFPARYQSLAPVVARSFDLEGILRLVVGPRWADMPREMQTALLGEFHRFTVASYVANFDDDHGTRLEILPATRAIGGDVVVETRIVSPKADPVRLDYVMHQTDGQWQARDVLLDGTISRVAVQRSDFRHILENGGPLALIASLRRKVSALSGGTLS